MENIWKKVLAATVLILLLCLTVFVKQWRDPPAWPGSDELAADLNEAPCGNGERLAAVRKLFIKMGAGETDLSVEKFEDTENLVITKPGNSPETIIVGAHYDKTDAGCGVIDNWTGIVITANLYRTLKDTQTEKTYKFVALGDEEKGLIGSRAMARAISEDDLRNYCAMVNFDSFGFSYPQALGNVSDTGLISLGREVAGKLDLQYGAADIPGADADSTAFRNRRIPAVTFHGMAANWKEYLHTENDREENIKLRSVYLGYRFGLSFLHRLDVVACGAFR